MTNQTSSTERKPGETLLEHGLEFVLDAVRRLDESAGDEKEARYAIVHLAIGMELLLKSRLFRHDWKLVFEGEDQATEHNLQTGDFRSVTVDECIKRLHDTCGITLTGRTKKAVHGVLRMRNMTVHFAYPLTEVALRSQAAKALSVIVDFVDEQCAIVDDSIEDALRNEMLDVLQQLEDYVAERTKTVESKIAALGEDVYDCPLCDQKALVVDDGAKCLFCFGEPTIEQAVEQHAEGELEYSAYEAMTNGGSSPFVMCPNCGEDKLLRMRKDSTRRRCFACGALYDDEQLASCVECGIVFVPLTEDDDQICSDCLDAKD
jgi:predicted RNA-binding Zn-ribbon protein involved in translation (DUF1610 family)